MIGDHVKSKFVLVCRHGGAQETLLICGIMLCVCLPRIDGGICNSFCELTHVSILSAPICTVYDVTKFLDDVSFILGRTNHLPV